MKLAEQVVDYDDPEDKLGKTSSISRGIRLNGSVASLNNCCLMVERSTVILDVGKITGVFINVAIKGSGVM